jgi:hypothetical protein
MSKLATRPLRWSMGVVTLYLVFGCTPSISGRDTAAEPGGAKAPVSRDLEQEWVQALTGESEEVASSRMARKSTGSWNRVFRGISSDGSDGIFLSGSFFGDVALQGKRFQSKGRADVLVGRVAGDGRVLWLKHFGGPGSDISADVVEDSRGRAILTGNLSRGIAMGSQRPTVRGASDAFTAQLSPQGEVLWLHTVGGSQHDSGNEIAADADDNILVAANTYGEVATERGQLAHRGGMDGFLLKYDSRGRLLWTQQVAGPGDDQLRGIAADSDGNIAVVGEFADSVSLGGQTLEASGRGRDILVARYTPEGKLMWSRRFGGRGEDFARGVDVDSRDNLYIAGVFSGTVQFDSIQLQGEGRREQVFVARLSPAGKVQWARALTGNGVGHGCEIDVNAFDRILIGCDVRGELGMDQRRVRSTGDRDSFVAVFDTEGALLDLRALGATKRGYNFDIVGHPEGHSAFIIGVFQGELGRGGKRISASDPASYIARLALTR